MSGTFEDRSDEEKHTGRVGGWVGVYSERIQSVFVYKR